MSRKDTIELFRQIAQERGGECLSTVYVNNRTELEFKCLTCKKTWKAKPCNIKGSQNKPGTWCPPCGVRKVAKARTRSVESLQVLAKEQGGLLISSENLGSNKKHMWRCRDYPSHQDFEMIPNAVQQGQWCPKCRKSAKATPEELNELARQIAKNPMAKCDSTNYKNTASLLNWWCGIKEHPTTDHIYRSVKYEQVHWCKLCKQERARPRKYARDHLVRLAKHCGGILLSKENYRYKSTKQKFEWQCPDNHTFSRALDDILQARSFCPYCFKGRGLREEHIRELFFFMFNSRFERTRNLSWLINKQGKKLELDGYNPNLNLAFEHNGQQHYEIDGYYTKNEIQLNKRRSDDEDKLNLCKENGVVLIIIPFSISLNEIQNYVFAELARLEIKPLNTETFSPGVLSEKMLERLQGFAANHGGRLLSDKYLGSGEKHDWQCKKPEHPPFSMAPSRGSWCSRCADEKASESYKISKKQVQEIAQNNHCELILDELNEEMFASYDKARFLCLDCKKRTTRTIQQAKDGSICFCKTKKVRIDLLELNKKLAPSLRIVGPDNIEGGKTILTLQCQKCEYQWPLKALNIKNRKEVVKCDKCTPSRNAPITIEKARKTGEKYGFKLESDLDNDTVVNGQSILHYKCKNCDKSLDISFRLMRNRRRCPNCTQEEANKRLGIATSA